MKQDSHRTRSEDTEKGSKADKKQRRGNQHKENQTKPSKNKSNHRERQRQTHTNCEKK